MGEKISLNNILIDYWGMVSYHTSSPLFESICRYYTTTYRFYNCTRKEEKQKAKEKGKDIPNWMQTDKKDFLSEWYKEIEESNRMGKTRDLFRKIRDT